MNILRFIFVVLFATFGYTPYAVAQEQAPLNAEWLARDFQAIELVSQLTSPSALTVQRIKDILEVGDDGQEDDLGFDTTKFDLGRGNGYTRLYVEGLAVKGRMAVYKIGIESSGSWPRIRERIIELWKQNHGPEFTETATGIVHVETNEAVLQSYKTSVAAALGEMKQVEVPDELKQPYDYLTSALDCRAVERQGHVAIAALIDAKRVDLLENILRGFSPSGRVHAARELLKLSESGQLVLRLETLTAIEKIRNLDITITVISGCIVTHLTADEILSEEK